MKLYTTFSKSHKDRIVTMKSIDILAPVYNEEDCLHELANRIQIVIDKEPNYKIRLILIENGSEDKSWEIIQELSKKNRWISCVKLARNFGMDGGLTAGLEYATADAAVLMTSDLQDPPEVIHDFIRKWEEGFDNVYAHIDKRTGISLIRRMNSQIFYWLAGKLAGSAIPRNVSDYRLLSRKAYESLRGLRESNRVIRGLVGWMGFKSASIAIIRPPRFGGESKAHSWHVIGLGVRAILAHTYAPLRLISLLGVFLSFGSVISLIFTTALFLFVGVPFPGFGTLITVIVFLFGILFLMLGIMAEYLALIYEEVKRRPSFLVDQKINLK